VRSRWREELEAPEIAAYVATDGQDHVVGFAARRNDELLHFGTEVNTWGTGLATWLHDELVATFPSDVRRIRLRVFADNARARRFYEKLGWVPTGETSRTTFPPNPLLVSYALDRGSASQDAD
jgi:RimJ/RimL family protein N-acetyltransferase